MSAAVAASTAGTELSNWRRNLNLCRELAITQFKLKYTGSALGYVWSLLKPMANFAVMYVVFALILKAGASTKNFPIQLLLGIVWWMFFAETTNAALASIATSGSLIRKAYFPRVILVLAATLNAFMTFVINIALVVAISALFGQLDFGPSNLMLLPLIVEMYLFSLGMGLLLAALFVFYRDIGHLWEVFTQILFYASAVVYPLSIAGARASRILALNPVAQMINDLRRDMVDRNIKSTTAILGWSYVVPFVLVGVSLVLGWLVFKRRSPDFAEYL